MAATIIESSSQAIEDGTVCVAVGKDVNKSKSTLSWALQNLHARNFCILHVHQLAKVITSIGGNSPSSTLEEQEVWAIKKLDRKNVQKILDDYILICHDVGVYAEKLCIEMDDIGEGILELANRHCIKKLVMGAAADKHHAEGITRIKSRKAIYVHEHLPLSCQIWFICGGQLIQSRKGGELVISSQECTTSISETGWSNQSRSPSGSSNLTGSSSGVVGNLASSTFAKMEANGWELEAFDLHQLEEILNHLPTSGMLEGTSDYQLLNQLEQSLLEAEKLKREAYEESVRRVKAEKTTVVAVRKARALEMSYNEELRRRKEIEEVLAKEKYNLEYMKQQWDEDRVIALDHRVLLESQVANFDYMMKKLDDERQSAVELSQVYKKERDEVQVECNNARKLTEELLQKLAEASSSVNMHKFFSVFSLSEIHEASRNFDPSLKIGEQGYMTVYKGLLHSTPVAIKVLNQDSSGGPSEFQQEVGVMSKIRHPNLITLIGACPEACALVYEYLPNGNLEDRLSCKDNSPPLSWQTRIRIASEICSVLIFLHSRRPHSLVYGNLETKNVLLDANFVCKLSDFRIPEQPRFLPKSQDIYLFGIILLQLLIGRSPLNIAEEMQDVLDQGNLEASLDVSAGDWPFVQATQLAHLALRCCHIDPSRQPDLVEDVWRVLEPMRASCGASSSFWMGSEERSQPPSYFNCPILQEVMENPHVAADGFTYEKEALLGWLESGRDTSPMTNIRLEHRNLLPNYALRSAIQEWLQQHGNVLHSRS